MARVDIVIPEPSPEYTEENQRQINQSLRTMQDKLNTSYQQELKNEQILLVGFIMTYNIKCWINLSALQHISLLH